MHVICDLARCFEEKKQAFSVVLEREKKARKTGQKPRKRLKREKHPARWIKDACRASGGGFIADFRPIGGGPHKAINYVLKYTFKQIEINIFPKHVRRIQASRNVGSPKRKGVSKIRSWRARSAIWASDFDIYERIFDISIKREVTIDDDFSNGEFYYPPEMS